MQNSLIVVNYVILFYKSRVPAGYFHPPTSLVLTRVGQDTGSQPSWRTKLEPASNK